MALPKVADQELFTNVLRVMLMIPPLLTAEPYPPVFEVNVLVAIASVFGSQPAGVPALSIAPPPAAVLLLNVLFVTTRSPRWFEIAPPPSSALLPEKLTPSMVPWVY